VRTSGVNAENISVSEESGSEFDTRLVFRPEPAVVSIRRDQNGGVINNGIHAERRRLFPLLNCA
jgi:hypothetical protein